MKEKILLVDDEEGIRRVLAITLEDEGYEVLTAGNGEDAMKVFEEALPRLVLTDIKMPGMDGVELLQRIKERRPDTEVIMMTGHGDLELAIKSLQFEAADFITKPIHDDALDIALKRARERIALKEQVRVYTDHLEQLVAEKTQQLLDSERLAAIGQTVATLAHAIKNIIGGLKGGMYVLEKGMELDNGTYLSQGWEMLKGNVGKISNLALDLLNYAKERAPDYQRCDPNRPLAEVYQLMRIRAEECGARLRMEVDESMGEILMDPEAIHCCLLNLVGNALDACQCGGSCGQPAEIVLRSRQAPHWGVEYQVEDNGCGLDENTREKVFKAFFSTKGTKGTGLGLMITQKIIKEHGGEIELDSRQGKGTVFTVRLPDLPIS
ncbi:MAG: response regulator [Syntrophobacteraceae bacterium]|jgi:signal transduction histidine kinase|nr:response regulator [Syntrophobacteraceae bacterium]